MALTVKSYRHRSHSPTRNMLVSTASAPQRGTILRTNHRSLYHRPFSLPGTRILRQLLGDILPPRPNPLRRRHETRFGGIPSLSQGPGRTCILGGDTERRSPWCKVGRENVDRYRLAAVYAGASDFGLAVYGCLGVSEGMRGAVLLAV